MIVFLSKFNRWNRRYVPEGRARMNPQKKKKPETAKTEKNPYASSTMSKFWAAKSSKRV
jgi:hypothetical protein